MARGTRGAQSALVFSAHAQHLVKLGLHDIPRGPNIQNIGQRDISRTTSVTSFNSTQQAMFFDKFELVLF
jgi:hypothetical protein